MIEPIDRRQTEKKRLEELKAKRPPRDPLPGVQGVLLSDAIRTYVDNFDLIRPFAEENLKPANYKLCVGDEYALAGQIKPLMDRPGDSELVIPPFEVAIIKTRETLNVPGFLIARWNIQVSKAYEGLLWVGGPQVDAGYVGHLFCPIYNLSGKPVTLRKDDPFAVIDFVKTSEVTAASKPYETPTRILFEDYSPQNLKSGLASLVNSDLRAFRERIDGFESTINTLTAMVITGFGVLFAVLGLFVSTQNVLTIPVWNFASVLLSFIAIFMAIITWKSRFKK